MEAGGLVRTGRGVLRLGDQMDHLDIRKVDLLERKALSRGIRTISRKQPKKKGKPSSRTNSTASSHYITAVSVETLKSTPKWKWTSSTSSSWLTNSQKRRRRLISPRSQQETQKVQATVLLQLMELTKMPKKQTRKLARPSEHNKAEKMALTSTNLLIKW